MLNMTSTFLNIVVITVYTVYLFREIGYECQKLQDLNLAVSIFNTRVVNIKMKGWRVKLREAFGIDAIVSVIMMMQQLRRRLFDRVEGTDNTALWDQGNIQRDPSVKESSNLVSTMKWNPIYFLEWSDCLTRRTWTWTHQSSLLRREGRFYIWEEKMDEDPMSTKMMMLIIGPDNNAKVIWRTTAIVVWASRDLLVNETSCRDTNTCPAEPDR